MRRFLVAVALVAPLIGCGSSDDDTAGTVGPMTTSGGRTDPTENPTPTTFTATSIVPSEPSGPVAPSTPGDAIEPSSPAVQAAVADLAQRLAVDAATIAVVDARAVTWGDSSLGCPQPGMQYLQRLVDGMLVVLEAGGRRYEYHGGDPLLLCADPKPPSGGD